MRNSRAHARAFVAWRRDGQPGHPGTPQSPAPGQASRGRPVSGLVVRPMRRVAARLAAGANIVGPISSREDFPGS